MTTKKLVILAAAAVILIIAAYLSGFGKKIKAPSLVGKPVMAEFDMSKVARIEIGGPKKLALSSTDKGWVIDSLYGYPADLTKIRENLLKLKDLKVGHLDTGKKLTAPVLVDLQDAAGKSLAAVTLGETHQHRSSGEGAQFGGGYPDGRYVMVGDQVALVRETLDEFDGDPKKWTSTQIADIPSADVTAIQISRDGKTLKLTKKNGTWTMDGLTKKEEVDSSKVYSVESALSYLNFTGVADPAKTEAQLGFSTGVVYTAMLKNGRVYTARLGTTAENGTDRYVKLQAAFSPVGTNAAENAASQKAIQTFNAKIGKWTYTIASYNAENISKSRSDLVKAKEEPKKEEAKPAPSTRASDKVKSVSSPVSSKPSAKKPVNEKKSETAREKQKVGKEQPSLNEKPKAKGKTEGEAKKTNMPKKMKVSSADVPQNNRDASLHGLSSAPVSLPSIQPVRVEKKPETDAAKAPPKKEEKK